MQIKTPNSPKTKYSMKVLKSQSINSNYLSQLEACFALSATNKLCLTVWWLFQSGYKGEFYFGAAHLEGVLVNVFYFQTLLFLSKLLQTWVSGKAWLIWSQSCFVIQILLMDRRPSDLFPGQPLVPTEKRRLSVWDNCPTWEVGISEFWEGEKGREEMRRHILEEELKTKPAMFRGTVFFYFTDSSHSTGERLKLWDLDKLIPMTGSLKLSKWRTRLN